MGQKRIKMITGTAEEAESRKKKKKTGKKKSAKVPGLKGGQRVVAISSEPVPAEVEVKEEDKSGAETVGGEVEEKKRRAKKQGQPGRGRRYQRAKSKVDQSRAYSITEAVKLVKETSTTRFVATIEAHLTLKETAVGQRGSVQLPHGSGKTVRVMVFGEPAEEADLIGDEAMLDQISSGKIPQVDVIIATPEWMPKLAKVAKFLGPKGLMPNPKSGTVTSKPANEIRRFKSGRVEYRAETKTPIIHLAIGKVDWEEKKLEENFTTLINAVGSHLILGATLSSTMGPGIRVDFAETSKPGAVEN